MDRRAINQQLNIEQDLLHHIIGALREALRWETDIEGTMRKVSTLRFLMEAFQRHIGRLWAIHEHDGYMSYVIEAYPRTQPAIEALKDQHEQLRDRVDRIVLSLERLPSNDADFLSSIERELSNTLDACDQLAREESKLIQESFTTDIGGEG